MNRAGATPVESKLTAQVQGTKTTFSFIRIHCRKV